MDLIALKKFPPQTGCDAAARLIRRRALSVLGFKNIFITLGRADITDGINEVPELLETLVDSVSRFNNLVQFFFTGPIPRGSDNRRMVAHCVNAGEIVKSFCSGNQRCEFVNLAKEYYTKRGVNHLMMLPTGATALGRAACRSAILSKCSFWPLVWRSKYHVSVV